MRITARLRPMTGRPSLHRHNLVCLDIACLLQGRSAPKVALARPSLTTTPPQAMEVISTIWPKALPTYS